MTKIFGQHTPVFDANTSGGKDLGKLPEWDLSDLYSAPDSNQLTHDFNSVASWVLILLAAIFGGAYLVPAKAR